MEYLVTMTTHVPDGTPDSDVEQIRAVEAVRARELAAQGHLLRLWRPPLHPGEWRTLGLFAASDDDQIELVLATMPLRIWRRDQVTALSAHPDDPGLPPQPGSSEFLTTVAAGRPADDPDQGIDRIEAAAAAWTAERGGPGHLLRLWRLAGGAAPGPVAGPGSGRDAGHRGVPAASGEDGPRADAAEHTPSDPVNAARPTG